MQQSWPGTQPVPGLQKSPSMDWHEYWHEYPPDAPSTQLRGGSSSPEQHAPAGLPGSQKSPSLHSEGGNWAKAAASWTRAHRAVSLRRE